MPSEISGPVSRVVERLVERLQGRTAVIVGFVVLAVSGGLWLEATGILHGVMIDLITYQHAAHDAHHNQSGVYTKEYGVPGAPGPFLYPPFALAVFMQFDAHSIATLGWWLSALSAAALLVTIYTVLRRLVPSWSRQTAVGWTMGLAGLALWLEPVDRTFTFGQVSLILMALVIVDLTLPDTSRWKGVGTGLAIAIKLTPAVFVLYLLLTRRFRAAARAACVFVATMFAGYVLLPTASAKFWLHAIQGPTQINTHITIGDASDQSLKAMLFRMLHHSSLLTPAWGLLCLVVVAAGMYAAVSFHRRGDDLAGVVTTAGVGILVSPIAWTHHWVWVLPALLMLAHRVVTGQSRTAGATDGPSRPRLLVAGFVGAVLVFLTYPLRLKADGSWSSKEPMNPTSITWTQPHQDGAEFHWNAWNFLVGNLNVLAGLVFIGSVAWLAWSRRGEPVSEEALANRTGESTDPILPRARILLAQLRTRRVFEPLAVGSGAAALLFARLNFPKSVGVADNYDGGRLLCHFNLHPALGGTTIIQKFVTFQYVITTHNGSGCGVGHAKYGTDLPQPPYQSSQLLLIQLGSWLTRLLGLHSALDLRVLALLCCVLVGGAIGLLFAALRSRDLVKYGLCAALLLITLDASFIDFAASPLSEMSATIGLLYLLPAIVLLTRGGRARRYGLLLGLAAGFFLTMSKAQMELLAVPVAIVLAAFPFETTLRGRLNLTGRIGRRVLPVAAGCVLVGGTVLLTPAQDKHAALLTQGDFVFTSLLRVSPDPTADMKALGVPANYADLVGHEAWCNPTPGAPHNFATQPTFKPDGQPNLMPDGKTLVYGPSNTEWDTTLAQAISRGNVISFLLTHPDRAVRVANSAANDFFHVRPMYSQYCPASYAELNTNLGNYAYNSGKAPNSVDPIAPVTAVFSLFKGLGLIPLLVLWLAPFAAALRLVLRRRNRATGDGAALAWITVLLSVVATSQFAVSAFGDGIDTTKHLNLSIYATATAVVTAVAAWVLRTRADRAAADTSAAADSDVPTPLVASETIGHQA